jgi:hypothetical protein
MARIRSDRQHHTVKVPSSRTWSLEWVPLAVALAGFGLVTGVVPVAGPWAPLAGAVALGVGAYLLGRSHGQANPDPSARGRVSQLEQALLQLAVVLGNDGLARRVERSRRQEAPAEPRSDAGERGGARPADHDGPAAGPRSLDDPLPGET